MDLGIIGLGRMGYNMAIRLIQSGHRVIGNARTKETVDSIVSKGAEGAYSLDELIKKIAAAVPPRKRRRFQRKRKASFM